MSQHMLPALRRRKSRHEGQRACACERVCPFVREGEEGEEVVVSKMHVEWKTVIVY